ncbi:hypothetical protein [Rosenbergiella collisarenosi]|uniref:hypothetical protein n=1 Tax=Rosenbergiella collisarenosi TaxID=1544695 RepID=UPI001F4EBE5E|nr:hypothetical protein [Rosenbergiella collisarenosi]
METNDINEAIKKITTAIERNRNTKSSDRDIFMTYGCIELNIFIHDNPNKLSSEDILYIYEKFCGEDYGFTIHGNWIKVKNKIINRDCIAKIEISHQDRDEHSKLIATLTSNEILKTSLSDDSKKISRNEVINLIGYDVHSCYAEFLLDKIINTLK